MDGQGAMKPNPCVIVSGHSNLPSSIRYLSAYEHAQGEDEVALPPGCGIFVNDVFKEDRLFGIPLTQAHVTTLTSKTWVRGNTSLVSEPRANRALRVWNIRS